jgi:hypothetical protein
MMVFRCFKIEILCTEPCLEGTSQGCCYAGGETSRTFLPLGCRPAVGWIFGGRSRGEGEPSLRCVCESYLRGLVVEPPGQTDRSGTGLASRRARPGLWYVLNGRRSRGRTPKRGTFRLSIILNFKQGFLVMSLTAVFGVRPTDERIGLYVECNWCSVVLNGVTFVEQTCSLELTLFHVSNCSC